MPRPARFAPAFLPASCNAVFRFYVLKKVGYTFPPNTQMQPANNIHGL